jgi:ribosome-associated protein
LNTKNDFKKLAIFAARLAYDKKGMKIKLWDLKGTSGLMDYLLVVNVDSKPHMDAVEDHISKELKQKAAYKLHYDGRTSVSWRVLDYGGFMAHIVTEEIRSFYGLDKLFPKAKEIKWKAPAKTGVEKPVKKKPVKKATVKK